MAEKRPGWLENQALDQLTTAINLGETEKALSLIKPGMLLDAVAKGQHRSPLFAAIETGNTTVVEALLAAGASLTATNDMGETTLHAAASKGSEAPRAAFWRIRRARARLRANVHPAREGAGSGPRGRLYARLYRLASDDSGRLPLILLPTPDKDAALLACGTNGINKGHDTEAVISWLMAMETENPFILAGCGLDFLDGRFAGPVKDAERLAERMIAFCPDMVDQAEASLRSLSRPDQVVALARQLSEFGSFGFWWD